MEPHRQPVEHALLDWHLNRLDDEQRSWLEAELERDAELRSKSDRLQRILQPLDTWQVMRAPSNLSDRILNHIKTAEAARRAVPKTLPPQEQQRTMRIPFVSMRDFVAAAACIILLIGVFVPGVSELRARSRQAMCAANLGGIAEGLSAYRQAFAASLPFAGRIPGGAWLPAGAEGRPYASNSRHVYLLVKEGYVSDPAHFLCPSDADGQVMAATHAASHNDFPSARNVSYASLNLAGESPNLRPAMPVAYLSDPNPLFVNARFNDAVDPTDANSYAHRGRGQSVLTLDGSARWMTSPVYGPNEDNLWIIDNIRRYTGIEAPTSEGDVQLVPGFPATDPTVQRVMAR